jgi:hypothetical protein
LNLELTAAERKAWEKDAIDAEAIDIEPPALPSPANTPGLGEMFGAWLKGFFGQHAGGYMSTSSNSTSSQSPPSSNENDQEPNA